MNMDEWLAKPVEQTELQKRHANSRQAGVSKTNPRAMRDWPYIALEERDYFNTYDHEGDRKVQIREITAVRIEELDEVRVEYRGYGLAYLKNGITFAARGEAQYVLIDKIPHHLKERLDTQPWPS